MIKIQVTDVHRQSMWYGEFRNKLHGFAKDAEFIIDVHMEDPPVETPRIPGYLNAWLVPVIEVSSRVHQEIFIAGFKAKLLFADEPIPENIAPLLMEAA